MDPVSVFTALHDTKCVSFAQSKQAQPQRGVPSEPYQIDLSRLSLYPRLLNAIVSQVSDKYLTARFLESPRKLSSSSTSAVAAKKEDSGKDDSRSAAEESDADSHFDEELETSSSSEEFEWDKVDNLAEPIIFSAPDCSSVQLAAAVAFKAQLPHLSHYNRELELAEDAEKSTGKAEQRELKKRVILIESVISSGEKTLETIRRIEEGQRFKVQFVVCIIDCDENGIDRLEQEGIRVMSLYNIGAILRILEITGRITNDQYSQVRQWIAKHQFHSMTVVQPSSKCLTTTAPVQPLVAATVPKSTIEVAAS